MTELAMVVELPEERECPHAEDRAKDHRGAMPPLGAPEEAPRERNGHAEADGRQEQPRPRPNRIDEMLDQRAGSRPRATPPEVGSDRIRALPLT